MTREAVEVVRAVRRLHAWRLDDLDGLVCSDCETTDCDEAAPAPWPCPTADLVYSPEERADTEMAYRIWKRWGDAREYRQRMASGWDARDDNALMMRRLLAPMLRRPFLADVLLQQPGPEGGSVKYGITIPISSEAAR